MGKKSKKSKKLKKSKSRKVAPDSDSDDEPDLQIQKDAVTMHWFVISLVALSLGAMAGFALDSKLQVGMSSSMGTGLFITWWMYLFMLCVAGCNNKCKYWKPKQCSIFIFFGLAFHAGMGYFFYQLYLGFCLKADLMTIDFKLQQSGELTVQVGVNISTLNPSPIEIFFGEINLELRHLDTSLGTTEILPVFKVDAGGVTDLIQTPTLTPLPGDTYATACNNVTDGSKMVSMTAVVSALVNFYVDIDQLRVNIDVPCIAKGGAATKQNLTQLANFTKWPNMECSNVPA